jgi:hypothetical protein
MNFSNVPSEMKAFPNWVAWRYETVQGRSKQTKIPYSPTTGRRADSTHMGDWASFPKAYEFYQGGFDGLGFMFSGSPFAGVDFDELNEDAHRWIQWLNSYTEASPSGRGVHVIVRGAVPAGKRRGPIEVYSEGRYFTVTGEQLGNNAVREVDLGPLFVELGGQREAPQQFSFISPTSQSDEAVLRQASHAQNAEKFKSLWMGGIDSHGNDHSAADQALMNILAFYTQDTEQLKRMFRISGLGQRKKAHREDYLDRTIRKAFDQLLPVVKFEREPHQGIASQPSLSLAPAPLGGADSIIPNPGGMVGEIAEFIYRSAPVPIWDIAIAGALGLMSGICARSFSISGKGLNQYIVLLAKTGRGKEAMASGIAKLFRIVSNTEPAFQMFAGPSRIASGPALLKRLQSPIPSFLSIMAEMGHWMQELCGPRATANDKVLRSMILDLYSKSGPNDMLQPLIYSDTTKNTLPVRSPGVTILGESTPSQFYEALDLSVVEMGLLPRMLIIEYTGPRAPYNEEHESYQANPDFISRLTELCAYSLKMNNRNENSPVQLSWECQALDRQFRAHCDERINTDEGISVELWNRAHMKVLKTAAVLAVGNNPYQPAITPSEYNWALSLVQRDIERVSTRFESGQTGNQSNVSRQTSDIEKVLRDFLDPSKQISEKRADPAARSSGYISHGYIRYRLSQISSYSRSGDSSKVNLAIDISIKQCMESGILTKSVVKLPNGGNATYYGINAELVK